MINITFNTIFMLILGNKKGFERFNQFLNI